MESISKCPKKVEYKLESYKARVCQTCEKHSNNPSYCNKDKVFVQRKDSCDTNYKWNGQFLQRLVEVK